MSWWFTVLVIAHCLYGLSPQNSPHSETLGKGGVRSNIMHEDRVISGRLYRAIVEGVSVANPEGLRVEAVVRRAEKLEKIGESYPALPMENESDLLERAWSFVAAHVNGSSGDTAYPDSQ